MADDLELQAAPGDNLATDTDATSTPTAPVEGARTDAGESDTGAGDDSGEYVSPFAGKTIEEIAKDPEVAKAIADREAKLEQSHKDREANATKQAADEAVRSTYRNRVGQAQALLQNHALSTMDAIVKAVEKGEHLDGNGASRVAPTLAQLSAQMGDAVFLQQHQLERQAFDTYVADKFPAFKVSPERVSQLDLATSRFDPLAMVTAKYDILADAVREAELPKLEAAQRKRAADEAQLEREKNNKVIADGRGRPTNGAPGTGKDPQTIIDTAAPGSAAWKNAMKAKYGDKALTLS